MLVHPNACLGMLMETPDCNHCYHRTRSTGVNINGKPLSVEVRSNANLTLNFKPIGLSIFSSVKFTQLSKVICYSVELTLTHCSSSLIPVYSAVPFCSCYNRAAVNADLSQFVL